MRAVVLASTALLALTGCGGGKTAAPAPVTITATQAWDTATLTACKEARAFAGGGTQRNAESARSSAALSDVPALREAVAKFDTPADGWTKVIDETNAMSAAYTVGAWCLNHKVPGSR
jgi:hypothetical protein